MKYFIDIFKIINEITEVRRMETIERVLFRQKKDLVDYMGTHLVSIIRMVLVSFILYFLFTTTIIETFSMFWIFTISGFIFLLINRYGYKVPFFIVIKFLNQIIKMIPISINELKSQQKNIFKEYQKHNLLYYLSIKVLIIFVSFIFLPVPYVIMTTLYLLVLFLLFFTNNDNVSLIIGYFIGNIFITVFNLNPLLYVIIWSPIVFLFVDYEIGITKEMILLVRVTTFQEIDDFKGSVLIRTSNDKDLIYYQKEYYLLDKKSSRVDIYSTNSIYEMRKKSLMNFFKKRSQNQELEKNNNSK